MHSEIAEISFVWCAAFTAGLLGVEQQLVFPEEREPRPVPQRARGVQLLARLPEKEGSGPDRSRRMEGFSDPLFSNRLCTKCPAGYQQIIIFHNS